MQVHTGEMRSATHADDACDVELADDLHAGVAVGESGFPPKLAETNAKSMPAQTAAPRMRSVVIRRMIWFPMLTSVYRHRQPRFEG